MELSQVNWEFIIPIVAPIILIQLILLAIAIIDLVRIEKVNGPKWVWIIVILFVNIVGPILYFVIGRRNN
ncbi:PLD nuclease N-terminal domain-containing protein [Cytobacillus praedii]|uniref:PLDc_N domain-containing protein n=1 Tax=Cytobacillus praedii TaxID=1742358 RepID=A0A4R1AS07_9BACI|nr:PLD nuclease N-terminal domain-containing protein [Cytobacillus praedii]MED3553442.1 PLD nuclease N-terminal domain-containing protein [Cytobacillus praedii]TCJ02877.1 PLDc_N domain-containing protein [Cytobacillus praedii]